MTAMANILNVSNLKNTDKVRLYGSSQQHHSSLYKSGPMYKNIIY